MANVIQAGEYEGFIIMQKHGGLWCTKGVGGFLIDKSTVQAYEDISTESSKSLSSGIARGLIGGAMLGGVGAVAGAVSAKSKNTYSVAVEWRNGKKSLLELDGANHKLFLKKIFGCGDGTVPSTDIDAQIQKSKKKERVGCIWGFLGFAALIVLLAILLFAGGKKNYKIVGESGSMRLIAIEQSSVTSENMQRLAEELEKDFSAKAPVQVLVFDNEQVARKWPAYIQSGEDMPELERHFIGTYWNSGERHEFRYSTEGMNGEQTKIDY